MRHRRPLVLLTTLAVTLPVLVVGPVAAPPATASAVVPHGSTTGDDAPGPQDEDRQLLVGRSDGTVTELTVAVTEDDAPAQVTATDLARVEPLEPPALDGVPRGVHVRRARFADQSDDGVRAAHLARDVRERVDPYFDDSTGGALRYEVVSQGNPASHPPTVDGCGWRDPWDVLLWAESLVGGDLHDRDEHLVLYTPALEGCDITWSSFPAAAVTWIAGDQDAETRWQTIAKAVADDVMLRASDTYVCTPRPAGDGCVVGPRGDGYDVLGSGTGPLNGAHLEWLGLLDDESTVRPTEAVDVELEPVAGLTGRRFVVLPNGVHVEYRGAVGRDADLADGRPACVLLGEGSCTELELAAGVVIHTGLARDGSRVSSRTRLHDAAEQDPERAEGDPRFVLRPGQSYVTEDGTWRVTTVEVGGTATVRVSPSTTPTPLVTDVEGYERNGSWWTPDGMTTIRWTLDEGSAVDGFSVLVNGVVRAEPGPDARSATVPLDPGANRVVVRATDDAGYRDGDEITMMWDATPPQFRPLPRLEVQTGPVSTSSVPLRLRWGLVDDGEVHGVLVRRPDGGYQALARGATTTTAAPGTRPWTLDGYDVARNRTRVSFERAVEVRGERLAEHTGRWASQTNTRFTHGTAMRASTPGAELTFTTTARSIAWTAYARPTGGRATVFIDGRKAGVVDTRSATPGSKVVFAKNWIYPGEHTIRVVVEGTTGRPMVLSDGFVLQR